MKKYILHQNGVAADAVTGNAYPIQPATVKLGVDVHQSRIVVVAQEDHATPRPARSFAPEEFEPWVERLLARGHRVFAVYEACSPMLLPPLVPGTAASVGLGSGCSGR